MFVNTIQLKNINLTPENKKFKTRRELWKAERERKTLSEIQAREKISYPLHEYQRQQYILERIKKYEPKKILEIGPGRCVLAGLIAEQLQYQDLTLVDITDINKRVQSIPWLKNKVSTKICSVTELPYKNNEFDLIIAAEILEHIPLEYFKLGLKEIRRVSKNYIITIPFSEKEPIYKGHKIRFPIDAIKEHFPNEKKTILIKPKGCDVISLESSKIGNFNNLVFQNKKKRGKDYEIIKSINLLEYFFGKLNYHSSNFLKKVGIKKLTTKFISRLTKNIQNLFRKFIGKFISRLTKNIQNLFRKFIGKFISRLTKNIQKLFRKFFGKFISRLTKNIKKLFRKFFGKFISRLTKNIKKLFRKFFGKFISKLTKNIQKLFRKFFGKFISRLTKNIKNLFRKFFGKFISRLFKNIKKIYSKSISKFKKILKSFLN